MVYYEDSTLRVEWLDAEKWVKITRKEDIYVEGPDFVAGVEKTLELIRLHEAAKLLADYSNMRIINRPDQQYYIHDWSPRAYAAGLRHFGAVRPRIYAAQLSLQTILNEFGWAGISTAIFDNEEEAKDWLNSE